MNAKPSVLDAVKPNQLNELHNCDAINEKSNDSSNDNYQTKHLNFSIDDNNKCNQLDELHKNGTINISNEDSTNENNKCNQLDELHKNGTINEDSNRKLMKTSKIKSSRKSTKKSRNISKENQLMKTSNENQLDDSIKRESFKMLIKGLLNNYAIKSLRMLLRNNYEICSQFDPKELNKEMPMKKYKFTKRGGKLILVVKEETVKDDSNFV